MEIKKTDSLGLEILSQVSINETGSAIMPVKTKEEATKELDNKITLFIILEGEIEKGYFAIETDLYNKWIKDYKIEGVEI